MRPLRWPLQALINYEPMYSVKMLLTSAKTFLAWTCFTVTWASKAFNNQRLTISKRSLVSYSLAKIYMQTDHNCPYCLHVNGILHVISTNCLFAANSWALFLPSLISHNINKNGRSSHYNSSPRFTSFHCILLPT